ncbi:MAG: hypothetical protein ACRCT8_18205 [Lacipirellulaceae bacterium]
MLVFPLSRALLAALAALVVAPTTSTAALDRYLYTIDATDGVSGDGFGRSLDTDGVRLVVGAYRPSEQGAGYVFELPSRRQVVKFATDRLSRPAVAIDGDTALISTVAVRSSVLIHSSAGSVQARLFPSVSVTQESFGWSADLASGQALVGSPHDNNATVFDSRSAAALRVLRAADSHVNYGFGYAVALDHGLAVIGAPYSSAVGFRSGAAYVFDLNTGALLSTITAPNPSRNANFGAAVAIENGVVLIGAPTGVSPRGGESGAAYLFDAVTGTLRGQLAESSRFFTHGFGGAVSLDGGLALVGGNDPSNPTVAGQAFLFDVATRSQVSQLTAPLTASAGGYAASVTLGGGYAMVGSPSNWGSRGRNTGSVFVFDVSDLVIPEPASSMSALSSLMVAFASRRRRG